MQDLRYFAAFAFIAIAKIVVGAMSLVFLLLLFAVFLAGAVSAGIGMCALTLSRLIGGAENSERIDSLALQWPPLAE